MSDFSSKGGAIAPVARPARYHYLDALRGSLMFWGVLVHAGTLGDDVFFDTISWISGLVRMEAFYLISGFLGAMVLHKYGAVTMIKRRSVALLVPLVSGLVLLNPITISLITYFHNGVWLLPWEAATDPGTVLKGPMNWHLHLWFLFCLMVFVLMAPAVDAILIRIPKPWLELVDRMDSRLVLVAVVVIAAVSAVGTRVVFEVALEPIIRPKLQFITKSTGYYFSFYMIGMLSYRAKGVRRALEKFYPFHALAAGGLLYLGYSAREWGPDKTAEVLVLCGEAYVAIVFTSFLLCLAKRLTPTESRTARFLADSSYTVYMFHFLVIYLIAVGLVPYIPDRTVLTFVVAVLTLLLSSLFHVYGVRRSKFLSFLFNGKVAGETGQKAPPRR